MRLTFVLGCLLLLVLAAGCRSMQRPNWLHPGPASYQQAQAQRFDPYPEVESGPAIAGGRPREYDKPLAEPARARQLPWHQIQQ